MGVNSLFKEARVFKVVSGKAFLSAWSREGK